MNSEANSLSGLSVRELLLRYRRQLPSGACYFVGSARGIEEIQVPGPSRNAQRGVSFGFFERGRPPLDLAEDSRNWLHHYPFTHDVASTSMDFQEKLAAHIRVRLVGDDN